MSVSTSSPRTARHAASKSNSGPGVERLESPRRVSIGILAIDHDQVLDRSAAAHRCPRPVREGLFDDQHPVGGVAQQIGDLLRRRGVVDRERGRSEVHRRAVEQVELDPVGEHEADRVPVAHPQCVQGAGQPPDAVGVLRERDLDVAGQAPQRDLVRPPGGRALKRLAHALRHPTRAAAPPAPARREVTASGPPCRRCVARRCTDAPLRRRRARTPSPPEAGWFRRRASPRAGRASARHCHAHPTATGG